MWWDSHASKRRRGWDRGACSEQVLPRAVENLLKSRALWDHKHKNWRKVLETRRTGAISRMYIKGPRWCFGRALENRSVQPTEDSVGHVKKKKDKSRRKKGRTKNRVSRPVNDTPWGSDEQNGTMPVWQNTENRSGATCFTYIHSRDAHQI